MSMDIGALQDSYIDIGALQASVTATVIAFSGNLFIHGGLSVNDNLDLFIPGKDNKTQGLDLFISGPIQTVDNINLFVNGSELVSATANLFIDGLGYLTNNLDLFIKGYTPVSTNEIISEEYEYSLGISIIGDFETGRSVTIELWQNIVPQIILSNICNEIGDTGKYSWSLSNIPVINKNRVRYFWRMTDDSSNIVEGTFILRPTEGFDGNMPSLNNKDSYILGI